ncbi:MAG: hypothetical protein HYU66_23565, partial [Armatimonadetes bacterium]|nr:hypothetical protein [Armatimonadota bacterium]
ELLAVGRFLPREGVETDETWRQVIPYLVLADPSGAYFVYRRLPASGEARLVDLHSVGVGGHINDEHLTAGLHWTSPAVRPNLLADGLQRELREELVLPVVPGGVGRLRLHGFLALDETPVDRVHVGVVVLAGLTAEAAAGCGVRETDKLEAAGWHTPERLGTMMHEVAFEGWSRTLIEAGLPREV